MSTLQVERTLSLEEALKYLKIYNADIDWSLHLSRLNSKFQYKISDPQERKAFIRKIIACTILLPTYDKWRITDPPENLLYGVSSFDQFNDRDWVAELFKIIEEDKDIEAKRNECLSLGIVHPLEYSPVTRQAFNWLFDKAKDANAVTEDNKDAMVKRFQNLVYAYGGNVICYIFMKEEFKVKKILNWRSNYFFERLIFEVYDVNQILKIKKQELTKTNKKLIRTVRLGE